MYEKDSRDGKLKTFSTWAVQKNYKFLHAKDKDIGQDKQNIFLIFILLYSSTWSFQTMKTRWLLLVTQYCYDIIMLNGNTQNL